MFLIFDTMSLREVLVSLIPLDLPQTKAKFSSTACCHVTSLKLMFSKSSEIQQPKKHYIKTLHWKEMQVHVILNLLYLL